MKTRKKKLLSALLAVAMFAGLAVSSAGAAGPAAVDLSRMSIEQVADLDLNAAAPEAREAILAARSKIIYGEQAWTVNGAVKLIDQNTGSVTELPEFSELFPGWDLPSKANAPAAAVDAPATCSVVSSSRSVAAGGYFTRNLNVALKVGDTFANSENFFNFTGTGDDVAVFAQTGPNGFNYNIGFSDNSTGDDLGWIPNMCKGEGALLATDNGINYGVRGSASNEASASIYRICVTSDPEVYNNGYTLILP